MTEERLSMVVFSGTDDRLDAVATLATGAAALGRRVDLFLQYWALDSFRIDRIEKDHGVSPEAGPEGPALMAHQDGPHWSKLLQQAKEIGDVRIHACAKSMEMLGITTDDLAPLVDGVTGVAAFMVEATGQLTFI